MKMQALSIVYKKCLVIYTCLCLAVADAASISPSSPILSATRNVWAQRALLTSDTALHLDSLIFIQNLKNNAGITRVCFKTATAFYYGVAIRLNYCSGRTTCVFHAQLKHRTRAKSKQILWTRRSSRVVCKDGRYLDQRCRKVLPAGQFLFRFLKSQSWTFSIF